MKLSLSDKAYELIKAEIITCALEPGQQIAQQQLVERYQLGTTPIREALQRLAQEGLVQSIPRFGYTVSYVTLYDVHDVYDLRYILESAAARLAAIRGTDEQLDEIARVANLTYISRDGQSQTDFHVHNTDFHRSIAATSGSRRLYDLLSRLLDEMLRIFHLGLDLTDFEEEMNQDHLALVEALYDRDPDRAEQLMQSQILGSKQRILQVLTHRLGDLGQGVQVKSQGLV